MGIRETHHKIQKSNDNSTSGKFFTEKQYEINANIKCSKCNEDLSYQSKGNIDYDVFNCKCYTKVIIPIDNINTYIQKDKKCVLHSKESDDYCIDCNKILCSECKEQFHNKVFPSHHTLVIKSI